MKSKNCNHWEDILPDLSPEAYESLKASIADHGVDVPVKVDQHNTVIDGKARRRICDELGLDCPAIVHHVDSNAERLQLRLQLNCNRRHLTREQRRQMITAYLKVDAEIGNPELGELVGCDKKTVLSVRRTLEATGDIPLLTKLRGRDGKKRKRTRIMANTKREVKAATSLVSRVPDGSGIIPVRVADKQVRCMKRKQEREEAAAKAMPWSDADIQLFHCRFQDLAGVAQIVLGSVSAVVTDPPYPQDWLPQWDELGQFAAEVLKDGGLLVTRAGIRWYDRLLAALGKHLTYQWTMATYWTDVATPQYVNQKVVLGKWRPIAVFSKGTPDLPCGFVDTICSQGREKQLHDWQQPLQIFERLIETFSRPGDLVVDPCAGAFTTAVACQRLKRRCIACDIDEQCVRIGAGRLHQEQNNKAPVSIPLPCLCEDKSPVPCISKSRSRARNYCPPGQFVVIPEIQSL